jgi:hypothetical protein
LGVPHECSDLMTGCEGGVGRGAALTLVLAGQGDMNSVTCSVAVAACVEGAS